MIAFVIYLAVITGLIRYNGLFGLFNDRYIHYNRLALFFLIKTIAIPCFYVVYTYFYGGLTNFDTGKFYNDVKVINGIAYHDPLAYLRLLFGFQNDARGSADYRLYLSQTLNWDNGTIKDYFYNDNRVLIRVHSVLHFFAFNSYLVHALFSCFFSFTGIFFLYKTFRGYFAGKETYLLAIPCFIPALWFYTGGLLKEGLTVFTLGFTLYLLQQVMMWGTQTTNKIQLILMLALCCLLKPYLLLPVVICVTLIFFHSRRKNKHPLLIFIGVIFSLLLVINCLSVFFKHRNLLEAAIKQQQKFETAARSGIFLVNGDIYAQLPFDTSLIKKVTGTSDQFKIKQRAGYTYYDDTKPGDTLVCKNNKDTLTTYRLVYMNGESSSNISLNSYRGNAGILLSAMYYSLFYPMFYNAHGMLQLLASIENLLLLLALVLIAKGMLERRAIAFLPATFLILALLLCLLIGITTPNSGAIFRYRSPAIIFIFLAALYYLPVRQTRRHNSV